MEITIPLSIIQYVDNVFVVKIALAFFVAEATSHALPNGRSFPYVFEYTIWTVFIAIVGMIKCCIT